jgi:hypothetical protein
MEQFQEVLSAQFPDKGFDVDKDVMGAIRSIVADTMNAVKGVGGGGGWNGAARAHAISPSISLKFFFIIIFFIRPPLIALLALFPFFLNQSVKSLLFFVFFLTSFFSPVF